MHVDLICSCESVLNCEVPDEDSSALWILMHRFINAHANTCDYAEPLAVEEFPTVGPKMRLGVLDQPGNEVLVVEDTPATPATE